METCLMNGNCTDIFINGDLVLSTVKKGLPECRWCRKNNIRYFITIIIWIHIFIYFQFQY